MIFFFHRHLAQITSYYNHVNSKKKQQHFFGQTKTNICVAPTVRP